MRRVKRLNPRSATQGQDELFATHRDHAVSTDTPLAMLEAERSHRDHAIVEQVIAQLKSGPRRRTLRGLLRQRCVDGAVRPRPNLTRAAGVL